MLDASELQAPAQPGLLPAQQPDLPPVKSDRSFAKSNLSPGQRDSPIIVASL